MVTNLDLVRDLERVCDGGHEHVRIQGRETEHSGHYPVDFGDTVAKAVKKLGARDGTHVAYAVDAEGDTMMDGGAPDGEESQIGAKAITFKGTLPGLSDDYIKTWGILPTASWPDTSAWREQINKC